MMIRKKGIMKRKKMIKCENVFNLLDKTNLIIMIIVIVIVIITKIINIL